jgi:zinc protease
MKRAQVKWWLFTVAMGLAAAALLAQGPRGVPAGMPQISFEEYELPNGLEVILSEDHRLPRVAVNVWYHAGPANEEPGRTGFAHLFEHMMFQGSKHVEGDAHFRLLAGAGATSMNGTTSEDRTNYFETVPSNQVELALWLESDRMGYMLDKLDQDSLSNQQDVVRNERRQRTENRPYGIVEEAVYHNLYPPAHPYYADVIGSHADIQAAKLADVRSFFQAYYGPNNATIAIAGDFDPAAMKELVKKYFGTLQRGAEVPKPNVETPRITAERRAVIQDRVELERVYMAWITPAVYVPGNAAGDIAAEILGGGGGGGASSRLYKKLVYEKQIAQSVQSRQRSVALGSVFRVEATARPGRTAKEIEQAIDEELERFRREGPRDDEVEAARNMIEMRLMTRLETLNGVADRLNHYNHYVGDPGFLAEDISRYRRATAADVRSFAETQLKPSARVVIHGVPGTPDLGPEVPRTKPVDDPQAVAESASASPAAREDEPWRYAIPKPGPERPLRLPPPNTFELPNGLQVIHVERSGLPVVAARLVARTGSDANPPDKPGLASFMAAMLDQGTGNRTALEIADEAARLGATLGTRSEMDGVELSVRSMKRNFAAALHLLADVALHASFPEEELERQRARRLASLLQQRENPRDAAETVLAAVLYGPKHPYGYAEIGTESSIRGIKREDLHGFWKKNLVPNNASLVVAGDITRTELESLAKREFGAWEPGAPARPELDVASAPTARVVLVDKPGAAQTQLRIGMAGVPRATPDYAALEMLNRVLGGSFSSRINMNLREAKGYTYGANSRFAYRRGPGPFAVSSGVRTDVTAPAVSEVFRELRNIVEQPVSREEFTQAQDSMLLSLPGRFETTEQLVEGYASVFLYDLGADYYTRLPQVYSQVTLEDVRAAAAKYFGPVPASPGSQTRIVTVAVGDLSRIAPELGKLNLGPIEVRNADGSVKRE